MVSLDRAADVASITTEQELENDEELLRPLDRRVEELAYWEQQIEAALGLLYGKGLASLHMFRKGIESIDKLAYNKLSYYERVTITGVKHCLETGILTQEDLNKKYGPPLHSTDEQLFQVGDKVRVHHENYATRWVKPHLRTPGYLFGKVGVIQKCCGSYPNPEYFAYHNTDNTSHREPLYRVRFNQKLIWDRYEGNSDDTIDVEIYQHWLMPATKPYSLTEKDKDDHEHNVSHQHNDHHHDHMHEARAIIEQTAIDREGAPSSLQHLAESLVSALIDKNVINAEELRKQIENNQMAGVEQKGASIVVEAWLNPDFKQRLLNDATSIIVEFLKLDKADDDYMVLENTDKVHNLVVCTLCSCYPRQLLGLPPGWYKSRSYRVRAPRAPRSILKEFGTILPEDMKIQVHDSTADLRYLVIPRRPPITENWSREQLLSIVTRDSMIGACDITV
jgi:nitrile hydratase